MMNTINYDEEIRLHNLWRRQFLNAFAAGSYADMPLSGHRSCLLALKLSRLPADQQTSLHAALACEHERFHALCCEILDLSENGMASTADLLLPQLSESSHRLAGLFDELRTQARTGTSC